MVMEMQKDSHYAKYASQVTRARCVRKNAWISIFQSLLPVVRWSRRHSLYPHTRTPKKPDLPKNPRVKSIIIIIALLRKRERRERDAPAFTSFSLSEEKIKRRIPRTQMLYVFAHLSVQRTYHYFRSSVMNVVCVLANKKKEKRERKKRKRKSRDENNRDREKKLCPRKKEAQKRDKNSLFFTLSTNWRCLVCFSSSTNTNNTTNNNNNNNKKGV